MVTQIQVSFKITLSDQIPTKISSNHALCAIVHANSNELNGFKDMGPDSQSHEES